MINQLACPAKRFRKNSFFLLEWIIILVVAYAYCSSTLLDFDSTQLQQTGEQNESAMRPILADLSLNRYGQIPLWNPYMQTGFPAAGDMLGHFWAPLSTIPIILLGAINGMKVSAFIAFILAGLGQWYLARVCGLRGIFRLWSSLTFMLSGGLALLWRLGWYELLLGAVWFPFTYAAFWMALHKRNRASLVYSALCAAMILLTGGGYYPFYLLGTVPIILLVALISARPEARKPMLQRAIFIAVLIAGLIAVMAFPIFDGYRLIIRESGADVGQSGSQPISYALMNYLIAEPAWLNANILGTANGWNWFYLGPLSLGALLFLALTFHYRRQRPILVTMFLLTVVMLVWQASRFAPVKYIYDWIPFLDQLRFPNRLLIIAASPLLILSGFTLQVLYVKVRTWSRKYILSIKTGRGTYSYNMRLKAPFTLVFLLILFLAVLDTYTVNKQMAFEPGSLDPKSFEVLTWLKRHDPSLYYTDIGGWEIFWSWTPAAVQLEMPVFNFHYNQHLVTQDFQTTSDAAIVASPKYQVLPSIKTPDEGAVLLHDFDGVLLWYYPKALPVAFLLPETVNLEGGKLESKDVIPLKSAYDGPNQVKVTAHSGNSNERLVVLVSDYPGWKLSIDGKPAKLTPVNYYLGANVLAGEHTYTFVFDPPLYRMGLRITQIFLLVSVLLILSESVALKKAIIFLGTQKS
jgi:hypothetical protein